MIIERTSAWKIPPPDLVLAKDDVHLWSLDLDQSIEKAQALTHILSPDEIQRAEHFHFEKDRRQFIVGRAWLRMLLGNYIHTKPEDVRLCYGKYGKPQVAEMAPGDVLHFNLSHSQGMALYAFTLNRAIGVDVEHIQHLQEEGQIVAYFFSHEEKAVFCKLPADMQHLMFFKSWTQKEAYLKAIGEGLSRSLDSITVSLTPGEPAQLLRVKGEPEEHLRWNLQTFKPAPDYMAALAVEGQNWNLACWQGA
ncbi:MAG: 4'-phosphopantetheinyl transferase superfamily protein [Ktedonobacteraceae bacterium]|nr:4'-phosphopantetheinyl transferase superfamily protein [Ktedonobacteraceae bacterium]